MKLLLITQKVDQNDQLLGFFIGWLKRLAGKFESILVICLEKKEFDLPANIQVISLGKDRYLPKLVWLFNFYKDIFQYRKQYDAILVHMNPIWAVLGGWYWRLIGKKLFLWYTSGGITIKLKLAEKFSDTIFTASRESFRLKSKKVVITGHGIDTNLFKPLMKNKPSLVGFNLHLLSVGRIAPVKNYELLVEAAEILHREEINFSITMVGEAVLDRDKKYERHLKLKIAALNLQNYFNFLGKIENQELVSVYQSHDILIHLSQTGSVDKVLLEAMACGVAVLSCNESSRSFLPSELIFKEDDPLELTNKIKKIRDGRHDYDLREYVITNHNLDNLMEKISIIIKK